MALVPTSGMGVLRKQGATILLQVPGRSLFDPETLRWIARAEAAGGSFLGNSKAIADAFIVALHRRSYNSKIKYLLPMLGGNLATARVPLRDALDVGIAGSTGFVNADFNQATGLQGNGSSKAFDLHVSVTSLTGGIGYWENNINFSGTDSTAMGMGIPGPPDTRFFIDLRPALRVFSWGNYGNRLFPGLAGVNGHYYGQRNHEDTSFSLNGTSFATGTAADIIPPPANTLKLMGWSFAGTDYFWAGRCACAYVADGTLTTPEIADFHSLLSTKLFTPTGRPG